MDTDYAALRSELARTQIIRKENCDSAGEPVGHKQF